MVNNKLTVIVAQNAWTETLAEGLERTVSEIWWRNEGPCILRYYKLPQYILSLYLSFYALFAYTSGTPCCYDRVCLSSVCDAVYCEKTVPASDL